MKGTIFIDRKTELRLLSQFYFEPISRFLEGSSVEEPFWKNGGIEMKYWIINK